MAGRMLVLVEDLLDHLGRAADEQRAAQPPLTPRTAPALVGGQPRSRPMRLMVSARGGKAIVGRLLRGLGDEAVRIDADRPASPGSCAAAAAASR